MSLPTQQPAMMQTSAPLPANGAVQPLQAIKKHQPLMDLDCHRLRHLDPERPFSGMRDAVERLLPFHVRASARKDAGAIHAYAHPLCRASRLHCPWLGSEPT